MHNDKAGKELWDSMWEDSDFSLTIDPHFPGFRNAKNRRYHKYFTKVFDNSETRDLKLLEVGCAKSQWLPYFAKDFGFDVSGLDYSEIGCEQARRVLASAGIDGDIICADLFSPPEYLTEKFDVIFSFGVAEHFEPTASCLTAFSKLLKPGGTIVTVIPNMNGLEGQIQKSFNQPIFDIHVLVDAEQLATAHQVANFEQLSCDYFVGCDFSIPNLAGLDPQSTLTKLKQFSIDNLCRLGKAILAIEEYLGELPTTKYLSPLIIYTGKKPICN